MIYVAIGRVAGAALEKVLSPVFVADDNLMVGPSRVDVGRHQLVRARYWRRAPSRDLDHALLHRGKGTICVVVPPTPNGLLHLSRICSASLERGREIHVIHLAANNCGTVPDGIDPVRDVCLDMRAMARRLPPAIRWSTLETALTAALWRLWCRASPVAFSRFCGSVGDLHSQIGNLSRYHAGFFPRITDLGLFASRLDELILQQISHEWLTPAEMYAKAVTASSQLGAWLTHTGDLYLATRLLEWSTHTQGNLIERRQGAPSSTSQMVAWSFRWSTLGEAMLERLPEPDLGPLAAIGGAVAYGPKRLWVCRATDDNKPYVALLPSRRRTWRT